jgi:O-methyltransferase involved in polyketide biosynthesis
MTSTPASGPPPGSAHRPDDQLPLLRAEFPGWRIWREDVCGRVRYVARSRRPGVNPHTVVTADLGELREALAAAGPGRSLALVPGGEPAPGGPGPRFNPSVPSVARIYDHMLGGKDNYPADRAAAAALLEKFPEIGRIAGSNRAFLARAVRHIASQQVTQFVDLGAGLPASPNVHETSRQIMPGARVAYVDCDPMVLAHARALLAVDDRITVVDGDLRDPAAILASPALTSLIDFREPVGVLLVSVLHFLPAGDADALVAAVKDQMAPGSYLAISAGTSTGTDPALIAHVQAAYGDAAPVTARHKSEILTWFDGFSLARPGLTDVWAWRPGSPPRPAPPLSSHARFLAGVARKPASNPSWQP